MTRSRCQPIRGAVSRRTSNAASAAAVSSSPSSPRKAWMSPSRRVSQVPSCRSNSWGASLICRKETFLSAEKSVASTCFAKAPRCGIFRRPRLHPAKDHRPGHGLADLSGEVVHRDLAAGERLLVHAGHVGVTDPGVGFDIPLVPGFRNILFGGDGLFLATLTGPGDVALQSMPIIDLAEEIGRYLPGSGESLRLAMSRRVSLRAQWALFSAACSAAARGIAVRNRRFIPARAPTRGWAKVHSEACFPSRRRAPYRAAQGPSKRSSSSVHIEAAPRRASVRH